MNKIFAIVIAASVIGCTNATIAQFKAFGDSGDIVCYSGGVKIYEGRSTGKIRTEQGSDGWYFEEKGSDDLIRVGGDCLIRN